MRRFSRCRGNLRRRNTINMHNIESWWQQIGWKWTSFSLFENYNIGRELDTDKWLDEVPSKCECLQIWRQCDVNEQMIEVASECERL